MKRRLSTAIVAISLAIVLISCNGNVNRYIFPYTTFSVSDSGDTAKVMLSAAASLDNLPKEVEIDGKVYPVSVFGGYTNADEAKKVTTVTLPAQITSIENGAFADATNLKKAILEYDDIPASEITAAGFNSIDNVYRADGVEPYLSYVYKIVSENPFEVSVTMTRKEDYPNIPSTVKLVGNDGVEHEYTVTTFAGYENASIAATAEILALPSSITKIESGALDNCSSLKTLILENSDADISKVPSTVEDILLVEKSGSGEATVKLMKDTDEPKIPASITIGGESCKISTFSGWSPDSLAASADKLVIPSSITKVENNAFDDAASLKELYLIGEGKEIDTTYIPSTVDAAYEIVATTGENASIRLLKDVDIPATVEFDGTKYNVTDFYGYHDDGNLPKSITKVVIPSTIEKIELDALSNTDIGSLSVPTGHSLEGLEMPKVTIDEHGIGDIEITITGDNAVWPSMPLMSNHIDPDWTFSGWYYVDSNGAYIEVSKGDAVPDGAVAIPMWKISETGFGIDYIYKFTHDPNDGLSIGVAKSDDNKYTFTINGWSDSYSATWKTDNSNAAEGSAYTTEALQVGTHTVEAWIFEETDKGEVPCAHYVAEITIE